MIHIDFPIKTGSILVGGERTVRRTKRTQTMGFLLTWKRSTCGLAHCLALEKTFIFNFVEQREPPPPSLLLGQIPENLHNCRNRNCKVNNVCEASAHLIFQPIAGPKSIVINNLSVYMKRPPCTSNRAWLVTRIGGDLASTTPVRPSTYLQGSVFDGWW